MFREGRGRERLYKKYFGQVTVQEIDKKYFGVFIFDSGGVIVRFMPTGGERYSLPPSGRVLPS